jgi:hypothetical protein
MIDISSAAFKKVFRDLNYKLPMGQKNRLEELRKRCSGAIVEVLENFTDEEAT